jgi:hypothetical protein
MARQSTIKSMKALSALLFLAVAGLITAGVVKIRHDYPLTGTELIGWAFIPLALLLGFTLPVRCRVKRTNRKACGNWAYGLLFGCRKAAGHWSGKFLVRLRLKGDEAKSVESRKPSGNTVVFNQPVAQQSKPVKVTVEESALAKCGFWIGLVSGIVGLMQAIVAVVH